MKVVVVFAALLALSLAAPSKGTTDEKVVTPEKTGGSEKFVEKKEAENSSKEDKVVEEAEAAPSKEAAGPEENSPIVVVAASAVEEEEKEKSEEEISAEEKKKNHEEYGSICRASTGATQEQIAAIIKDPVDDAPTAVKCYIKCLAEQYGVTKDGVLQKGIAHRNIPSTLTEDEFDTIVDSCADLQTDDPCNSAYLKYSCYFRTSQGKIRIH